MWHRAEKAFGNGEKRIALADSVIHASVDEGALRDVVGVGDGDIHRVERQVVSFILGRHTLQRVSIIHTELTLDDRDIRAHSVHRRRLARVLHIKADSEHGALLPTLRSPRKHGPSSIIGIPRGQLPPRSTREL